MTMINRATALLAATLLLACNVDDVGPREPGIQGIPNLGKADLPGACRHGSVDYCGGQSPDGCWCNSQCMAMGDCCADDYDQVCGGGNGGGGNGGGGNGAVLLQNEVLDYRVLFTNPKCSGLTYDAPIPTADGTDVRQAKPQFVYCDGSDYGPSGARQLSPQHNLVQWISQLQAGDELFLAYLSYSNGTVHSALCKAAQRQVDITFVLDASSSLSTALKNCAPSRVTILTRGHQGGIDYAHNKVLIVNPNGDSEHMKMVFSSGNMSSGALIHHENWHFIEVKRASYFAQAHLCLMQAQLDASASSSTSSYKTFINDCRQDIVDNLGYPEEEDMQVFFIPNSDDHKKLRLLMARGAATAAEIDIGAHRFGAPYSSFTHDGVQYKGFQYDLVDRLQQTVNPVSMRMVADDDLYWLLPWGNDRPFGAPSGYTVGLNLSFEAYNTRKLYQAGGNGQRFEIRYLETNHSYIGNGGSDPERKRLLHHNKFIIYRGMPDQPDAVLCGAANLTGSGFKTNFENIYWVTMPAVVQAFNRQMARFWDGTRFAGDDHDPPVATSPGQMPAVLPPRDADPEWNL